MTSQLEPLVSVIVFVIKLAGIMGSLDDSANHESQVATLSEESQTLRQRDVSQNHVRENIERLIDPIYLSDSTCELALL